jgi:hypothetical protein
LALLSTLFITTNLYTFSTIVQNPLQASAPSC